MTAPGPVPTTGRRRLLAIAEVALLAAVTLLPQLLGGRGRVNADTKQYLYLDPGDLMERARTLWDGSVGGGTVTHQAIGYLWPMGPYYWATDQLGLPSWAAQRLWVGGIQFVAALGALVLFRHLTRRDVAPLAGALLYGLSPFVLGHVTGQSGLLLPFAALGWLVWAMARGVEEGGWRWPAVFALVVTTSASLNGSSMFFVVLAATLWVPFAVWSFGHATPRQGLATLVRTGGLTVVTQLWWLVAYAVGGAYGLPILGVTEQVETTSYTTSAAEIVRGLGYWFFYGTDTEAAWLSGLAPPYMERGALIVVSFAVPLVALALGAITRWTPRAYFAVLVGLGTVLAVGAFPEPSRSPVGAAFEALSRRSDLVLSLRNTQRAVPLVALGLAGLVVGGVAALRRRHAGGGLAAAVVVAALVMAAFPAQWRSGLIAERFHRDEDLPAAWTEAGRYLDQGSGRVLEVPGIDFASYRWGHTLDPVSVGLTDRSVLARELVPMGGAPGVTLLGALDRSFQEWWAEPGTLSTVARLLGASEVLVRNDLEYERYRTVRPSRFWPLVTDSRSDLDLAATFGPREPNRAGPARPMLDEIELALDPAAEVPPQLAVFDVPGGGRPAVSAEPVGGALVLDGDGEGIIHAAAAGLLDDLGGVLLLGADLTRTGDRFDELAPEGTAFVVTDTNRKRGERWYALRENVGATEPTEHAAALDDPSDARLAVVADQLPSAQTTAEWSGARRVWASAYGSPLTLVPEERPVNAFDGSLDTAWLVDTSHGRATHEIGIELDAPVDADHLVLVPPQGRPGARAVVSARVTLDGSRHFDLEVDEITARDAEGVRVDLDGQPFERLTVRIRGVLPDRGPAGFSEIRIPGVEVTEHIALPTALLDRLGQRASDAPLALVLTRQRADPAEPVRSDPEPSLLRTFELPAPVTLGVRGTARLSARAGEAVLGSLLGNPDPAVSSEFLPGDLRSRAAAAVDGDPTTAWRTPFVGVEGQWIDVPIDAGIPVSTLTVSVVADGRHSLPSRLAVSAGDDDPVVVDVPPLEDVDEPNGVRTLDLALAHPVQGDRLRVTIAGADPRTTPDWYTGDPIALPVGLAEVRAPGIPTAPMPDTIDTGCRDDLVRLDDRPLPVRVTGRADTALAREGLEIAPCGGAIELEPGRHELRTVAGSESGLDLDRLVLATPDFAPTSPVAAPDVTVDGTGPVAASATVDTDGSPFWLVLDQSHNQGWELSLDGATVDGPHPVDGYAAGWYVTPERSGTLTADIRWTPQRTADLAQILSLLAVLACIALAVRAPGRRRAPGPIPRPPSLGWSRPSGSGLTVVIVVGAAVALLAHPFLALPAMALAVLGRRWPWFERLLPVALVAVAALQVTGLQLRRRHEADFDWPQHFGGAHLAALLAMVLLGVLALADAPATDGDDDPAPRRG